MSAGTGKTSVVQYLANQLNQRLIVQNLSQQTDSSDLLGGFKPVELRILCVPLKEKFDQLFPKTFSKKASLARSNSNENTMRPYNCLKFPRQMRSF